MMRKPEYLSPSQIALYESDPTRYYLQYLSERPIAREPQNQAMSIGSAFDAFVKAYLYDRLFGTKDERYLFEALFEAQVSPQWRDWALANGEYVFEQYRQSGVLGDLMNELLAGKNEPRFEFEVRGVVHGYREGIEGRMGKVVLLGKPDVDFVNRNGVHCILDFKVNGYCSRASPMSHYLIMRSAGRTHHGRHPKCREMDVGGIVANVACYLEDLKEDWARQLAIYGWLCGEPVGTEFVTIIHQLACAPNPGGLPSIRIAEHVNRISKPFQYKLFDRACEIWEIVQSDWFFRGVSIEQSKDRCQLIEEAYAEGRGAD